MKVHPRILSALAILFALALPLGAFTLVEKVPAQDKVRVAQGQSFRTQVKLAQLALGDGSVRLQPGTYNVEVFSMGDGSVRGSFFDKNGQKVGEAHGIIAVCKSGGAAHAAMVPAVQKGANTKGGFTGPITFSSLNLVPTSKSTFSQDGGKMNLEITSGDGANQILIGLLLPAVAPAAHH